MFFVPESCQTSRVSEDEAQALDHGVMQRVFWKPGCQAQFPRNDLLIGLWGKLLEANGPPLSRLMIWMAPHSVLTYEYRGLGLQ